jgi:hypothetical protein
VEQEANKRGAGLAKVGYFRYFLSLFFTNPQNEFFQIVQILALVSIHRLC